ncbi:glycosyltransferase [Geobacillus sp. Geo 8.1]
MQKKYIDQLIISLKKQHLNNEQMIEIIVVDSSSTDNTVKILREHHPEVIVKVIDKEMFNHGETRNYLASLASGQYLLFMTQDVIPYDHLLISKLIEPFKKDCKISVSYARQLPKPEANQLEIMYRYFNYPERSMIKDLNSIYQYGIKAFFNSNACSMYKREIFEKLGKFQKTNTNEDMLFAFNAILNNYKVAYTADAKVYHSHNHTFKQKFKRYLEIGKFFGEHRYLLEYASNEKEGIKLIITQIKLLLSIGKFHLIPLVLLDSFIKLVAYRIGLKNKNLTNILLRFISWFEK